MATVGETSRPGYVYDSATDVWIPVGIGPHSHTPAAIGAISSSVVTTKGDLIVATGSGVVTRQGVGADGSYLVADSTQADGLNWAGPSNTAGKNAVLNSNMSVWQRGTSIASSAYPAYNYTADRWQMQSTTGYTTSRQVTGDTTNLPNIQYCARVQRNSGNAAPYNLIHTQTFESVNSIPFAGKTVTLSFYARKGANYSAASNLLTAGVTVGTGTDQNAITGFTGASDIFTVNATLTSTWQRFTGTGTVPASTTQIAIGIAGLPTGTAGTNDYFEITGVQLEVGSVATPYAPNGATYQAELAACQRYYYRQGGLSLYQAFTPNSPALSTTSVYFGIPVPVTMRVVPSAIDYATLEVIDGVNAAVAVTTANIITATASNSIIQMSATVASGLTQYRSYYLRASNSTSAYLGFSAEL